MQKFKWLPLLCLAAISPGSKAQTPSIDSIKFFTDENLIEMTLTTDIRKLQNEKKLEVYQDATVNCRFPDSSVIEENVRVCARGHYRRDNCTIPPLMLNFHNPGSPRLNSLGKLKLVIGCGTGSANEQLILKEYLCYKIYNLLDGKSFRVRLMKVNYRDSRSKMKPFSQYAFFIEDDNDLATRNDCIKKDKAELNTESTNRAQMTKVAVFQYLISNGDWSVPGNHNIKLLYDRKNEKAPPYAVPYDFDHSGLVNAGYALPPEIFTERFGTEKVTERVYWGFPRTMEELETCFEEFRNLRENINALINNFSLLQSKERKELINFIDEFYKTIDNKSQVQYIFIDKARRN